MFRNDSTKKVHNKFSNFVNEEKWLKKMLHEGWILTKYSIGDEDGCYYTFKPIAEKSQRDFIYKIDFREFSKKEDFLEYKDIFEDDGWIVLSKKGHSKHIFYTELQNLNHSIFSDTESYKERESRVMHSSLKNGIISFGFFIISIILYSIFERAAFIGGGLFTFFSSLKFGIDYFKHRKTLKTIL